MSKRRRWIGLLLVFALVAVFALAACGDDDDDETPTPQATDVTEESAAEEEAEATEEPAVEEEAEVTEEPTEEAEAEITEEPAEEEAEVTEEPTEEAEAEVTEEPAEVAMAEETEEPTAEAEAEVTEEPAEVAMAEETEEPAAEAEAEATEEPAEEAAEEVAEEVAAAAEGAAEEVEAIVAPALIDCEAYDLSDIRIGLVTDVGQVNDKSFNQSSWEGVLAAERCGATADYIETQSAADYADNIAEFAENDYDIVVTVGFALGPATLEAAELYPDLHFIGVDQFQGEPVDNVTGLVFNEDHSGYLAGVLAANLTETGTIAAVLGTDQVPPVVAFKEGYEAGARAVNPDITIISTYHPGSIDQAFTDPEWGASTARQALDQNADVVFGAGGKTGNGALIEVASAVGADEPPPFCIGVDTDQWFTVPEAHPCLVTSAMKLLDIGVAELITHYADDAIEPGNYFGKAGLAPFHDLADFVPQDLQNELLEVAAGLTSGEISTGYGMIAEEPEAEAEETEVTEEPAAEEEAEATEEPTEEAEAEVTEEPAEVAMAEETEEPAAEAEAEVTEEPAEEAAAETEDEGEAVAAVEETEEVVGAQTDMGTITVGMNAEYPPFEFVNEDGDIDGFDHALVTEIAGRAGFDVEFVNTRWDGIFVALASGEFDMVASAATITDEREEIVDFTDPYFNAGQMIAVLDDRAGEIEGPDDLAGLRVAVQAGTTGDILASELPGVEVVRYDEITLAFQALGSGDVDAVLNDGPVSADIIKSNPELNAVLVGEPLSDEFYGIAVQPDRPELLDAVNTALEELIADGTYADLHMEWFGVEPPEMFQPETETVAVAGDLGTVTVGLNAEYPPFEFVNEDGDIDGFDPDLMNAIAERAGFDIEWVNTRWDGIFVALASGEFDAVSSAATITDEREEIVDFSDPYFNAGQMIAVRRPDASTIEGPDDLAGLRVAVQAGTTGDILASELPGVEVVRYDEITLAFQALGSGDVDAVLNDGPVSADIIKSNPDLDAVLVGEPLSDEFYGIAVQPDRPELLNAINTALEELIADGTYAEIYMKWLGVEPPEMFQPAEEAQAN